MHSNTYFTIHGQSVGTLVSTSVSAPARWLLLFQGLFPHLYLMELQAEIALAVIRATASPVEGGDPPHGLPKLWLKFPQHASLWIEYTWCHWPSLPRGGVCLCECASVEVLFKPREHENNGWVVFLISVYSYCEPLSKSRCSSKDTEYNNAFFPPEKDLI